MKAKRITLDVLIATLAAFFAYIATVKIGKFEEFRLAIGAQPLAHSLKAILVYAVPASLIIPVLLLIIPKYRVIGLLTAIGVLLTFCGYIILIQLNFYGMIPCSCAGISHAWSWMQQLYFNLLLISVCTVSLLLIRNINNLNERENKLKYSSL